MANPLTGDFAAVLQISGRTINRLMASLHQNAGIKPGLPSNPHSISLRVGDKRSIAGVRGWVDAQLGPPRIELLHGVSDRFNLEVDVRARVLPDPGTTPVPEFVHGLVKAQYRLQPIGPECRGWKNKAGNYVWFRVVRDTVSFVGTAADDANPLVAAPAIVDEAEVNALITRQIAALLAGRFMPAPHKVSNRFRPAFMRSLSTVAGSVVAAPVAFDDEEPVGDVTSLETPFVENSDFAVAISADTFIKAIEPYLAELRTISRSYRTVVRTPDIWGVQVKVATINHTARITSASATWEAFGGDTAQIKVGIAGELTSDSFLGPSATVTVDLRIAVSFDAFGERINLERVKADVAVQVRALFVTQEVVDKIAKAIKDAVEARTDHIPSVPLGAGSNEMVTQLQTFDDLASARFQYGVFTADGAVLHGSIGLSPRRRPLVAFHVKSNEDGFSAYESWVPGGRIDRFTWSWRWAGPRPGDSATRSDRFILRRPRVKRGKWGAALFGGAAGEPLPGIDGFGVLCLEIHGTYVHPVTGALISFSSGKRCKRYGFDLALVRPEGTGRLFEKLWPEIEREGPVGEMGLLDVSTQPGARGRANTLILYGGERLHEDLVATLRRALEMTHREGAGLSVLVLVQDGTLEKKGRELLHEIDHLSEQVEAPVHAVEDVGGSWSARLAFRAGMPGWRLVAPTGALVWKHDGDAPAEVMARALETHLRPSPRPRPTLIEPATRAGDFISPVMLRPDALTVVEDPCPPSPFEAVGHPGASLTFVHIRAGSSKNALDAIHRRNDALGNSAPPAVVVVDGSAEAAKSLAKAHPDIVVLPDPEGIIARRFGIRVWPTSMILDSDGSVAAVTQGHSAEEPQVTSRVSRDDTR